MGQAVIVVDTNVIAYMFIDTEQTELAEEVYQKDSDWAAPVLWRSEFRNILSYHLWGERITLRKAFGMVQEAETLMLGREYQVQSQEVLRLAHQSSCSGYDCEFVTLAQELNVPLVSADRELQEAFPATVVSPAGFAES